VSFELGNLQVVVLHDRNTHEAYVIDPYEIGAMVPITGNPSSVGTLVFCPGLKAEPYAVQECLKTILEAMVLAAPELSD